MKLPSETEITLLRLMSRNLQVHRSEGVSRGAVAEMVTPGDVRGAGWEKQADPGRVGVGVGSV